MKIHVLWVRHCESCSNVITHSKSLKKKLFNLRQMAMRPPNCTLIGILQGFMFGFKLLPALLKKYPKFKKLQFYSSLLKRAIITSKMISYGLEKSTCKIQSGQKIQRICNVSEIQKAFINLTKLQLTGYSTIKKSNKQINQINKRYRKTGKRISKKIKKKTKKCSQSDYNTFKSQILSTLDPKSLNLIVSHGIFLKKHLQLKSINNLDAVLVEYDLTKNTQKNIEVIRNKTNLSKDYLSHKTIQQDEFKFNYQSNSISLNTSIAFDQMKHYLKDLSEYLQFEKRNNEITCK